MPFRSVILLIGFSPRMWRCFRRNRRRGHFLHVCGGVSELIRMGVPKVVFSPRMWRCFLNEEDQKDSRVFSPRMWRCFSDSLSEIWYFLIFSTYVEVFLASLRPYPLRLEGKMRTIWHSGVQKSKD